MDEVMPFVILFFLIALVSGPIALVLAMIFRRRLSQLSHLHVRLEALEAAVTQLERRVRGTLQTPAEERPPVGARVPDAAASQAPSGPVPTPSITQTPPPAAAARIPPARPAAGAPIPVSRPPVPPAGGRVPLASAPQPPSAPAGIDWERWIGIRGAALLGAIVLALAGLLLFQYSIQHGLITPSMRVVFGTVTGLGCLVGSEWLRSRRYEWTPDGLAGAGIVILYGSFWAAQSVYGLISLGMTFVLMVFVTVVCCLLAMRHHSQIIAVLGLIGGFATPLLLRSDVDRPFGLFGYVLLLDLGLLAIGSRRRWPALGVLSMLGTVLMQGLWITMRMGPDRLVLGLVILAVFAAVFAVMGRLSPPEDRQGWLISQAGALLVPFVFALYFASRVDLGPHIAPVALLMAMLCVGASWIGRNEAAPWLGVGASAASLAVIGLWLSQRTLTPGLAWEAVAASVGLSLIFHIFVELDRNAAGQDDPATAAIISACGFWVILILAAVFAPDPPLWPWLAGWLALAAFLARQSFFPGRAALAALASAGLALALAAYHLSLEGVPKLLFPGWPVFLGLAIALALVSQVLALARRDPKGRMFAEHGAAALAVLLLVSLARAEALTSAQPPLVLGATLVLGLLAVLAATRLGESGWFAAAGAATVLVHAAWIEARIGFSLDDFKALLPGFTPGEDVAAPVAGQEVLALQGFVLLVVAVLLFSSWPFLARGALRNNRATWIVAALAGPVWFLPLKRLFLAAFGAGIVGLLPILLAGIALAGAFAARRLLGGSDSLRLSALVWFAAVALSFVAIAIPLQLQKEWVTIGWALEGLAVIALWWRLDHPGLKYFGVLLLLIASLRLVANPAVLAYYPRSGIRILNWILYTYLMPAAALFAASRLLRDLEVSRAREDEKEMYSRGWPLGSIACGFAGILVVFAWINLAIADWYATGNVLQLHFAHIAARDLTVSISWAAYALMLLGFGMVGGRVGVRWLSLSFLVLTIGKVFLYDLGELRDLYRVASLVGLAISLLLVSLLYQRFVFRRGSAEARVR